MRRFATVLMAAVLTAGCGKSEEQKQAEEAAKASAQTAQDMAKGAQDMAKGLEAMAKGMQQMGATAAEPVSFRDLQTMFVPFEGWEMDKPTGEKMSMPVKFSEAEVTYRNGDSSIDAKIVDSALNQILLAPLSMFLVSGYEKETSDGYEKSTQVAGHPGWEKWDSGNKGGEVNAVVNRRFIVTLEGNQIPDTKVLHQLADKMNLGKLASLK
jgi:hypothetical protein